jgi:endonuclease/exonuclease/phosphatase family metal-dependent hydrolase
MPTLELVSWNVQWCRGADGVVDPARVVRDAHAFADFDVLCLQEVAIGFDGLPGSAGEDQFAALSARLPDHAGFFAAGIDLPRAAPPRAAEAPRRRQFGNALFSRLPVLQVWRHALPWPADAAVPSMQRVALEAVVQTDDGPLRIVTTHLEYYSRRQRAAQVDALRALHAEACAHAAAPRADGDPGEPFEAVPRPARALLCGDFNFAPDAAERSTLLAPFDAPHVPPWRDAWHAVHGDATPHAPTVGLHDRRWPLGTWDYAFVTTDLAPQVHAVDIDATTAASDHQPLRVRLGR